jgi:hypothetical protein
MDIVTNWRVRIMHNQGQTLGFFGDVYKIERRRNVLAFAGVLRWDRGSISKNRADDLQHYLPL